MSRFVKVLLILLILFCMVLYYAFTGYKKPKKVPQSKLDSLSINTAVILNDK